MLPKINVVADAALAASLTVSKRVAATPPTVTDVGAPDVAFQATIPQTVLPEVTPAPKVAVSEALLAETEL
jgi:hypothetical protein